MCRSLTVIAVTLAAACGTFTPTPEPDSGGPLDAGAPDAGEPFDAGAPDAGTPDGGRDGGARDAFALGAERRIERLAVPLDATSAPACSSTVTSGCLYRPQLAPEVTELVFDDDVSYVDVLGRTRQVPIAVYFAPNLPRPAPVVIMSHGGANGINDATRALREWASIVAGAGYLVVSLAHSDYEMSSDGGPSDYDLLCAAVGVPQVPGFLCALKVNWQRPLDLAAVVGWLENRVATNPDWAQTADLTRLAHFGHSAGSGAGMMVGGVTRNFRCAQPFGGGQGTLVPCAVGELISRRLAQVRAVVAFSPQGPGSDGFMTESYASLAVPMLMGTGLEDGDPGEPANREALFPLLPAGPRWKVYLDDPGAQHGLFGGNLDPCLAHATATRCALLRGALTSAALAFLDAQLRDTPAGTTWLDSNNLAALSGNLARITPR